MAAMRLLIVDASTIIYRACHTHSGLTNSEGEFTGGIFGFIGQVCVAILRTGATNLLIVFDSPPYLKAGASFKADRDNDADLKQRVATTKQQLKELLELTGIPHMKVPGAEADDVIAHVCNHCAYTDLGECIIQTGDSDMYQLLGKTVSMHKGGKHALFYTEEDLIAEHGVPASAWVNIISAGGSHNNVPGIRKGVATKTAIKLLGPTFEDTSWMTPQEAEKFKSNQKMNKLPFVDLELEPFDKRAVMWEYNAPALYQAVARWEIRITEVMVDALGQVSHKRFRKR